MTNRLLIPNTTQVPNVLIDVVMREVSDPALRVLLAIVRKTYGFQKQSDHISLTQLEAITGLSRQGTINGVMALGPLLTVTKHGKRDGNEYALNLDVSTGQLVNGIDQSTGLTSQRDALLTSQRGRHTKPKKNKTNIPGAKAPESSSIAKQRKLARDAGIPPELQPVVSKIVGRINELAGSQYRDDRPDTLRNLIARLAEGRTEAECLAVVDGRHAAWAENDKMLEYFRPSTLFAAAHFEDYLQAAQRQGHTNGTAKPKEVKDLGNGFVEVDGKPIERRIYERRFVNAAS